MPLYVYLCKKHGQFEEIVKLSELDDVVVKCPKCNYKTRTRQLTTPGQVQLVGGAGGFTGSKGANAHVVHKGPSTKGLVKK
jgi:putative FmdB family regulatory protein